MSTVINKDVTIVIVPEENKSFSIQTSLCKYFVVSILPPRKKCSWRSYFKRHSCSTAYVSMAPQGAVHAQQ